MFMAPELKGSPGFAVDQLKGIYYTKDIKIQRDREVPNTPGFFLVRRILGKGEAEPEALYTTHFLGVVPQRPPHGAALGLAPLSSGSGGGRGVGKRGLRMAFSFKRTKYQAAGVIPLTTSLLSLFVISAATERLGGWFQSSPTYLNKL